MSIYTPLIIGPTTPEAAIAHFFAGREVAPPEGLELSPITAPEFLFGDDLAWAWKLTTGPAAGNNGVVIFKADYNGWLAAEDTDNESDLTLVEYAMGGLELGAIR